MPILPKVALRALEPEDLDMLYVMENDRELWDVSNTNMPYSRFALHEYLASTTGDIYTDKQLRLIITTGDDEFVGMVDLANFNPQHQRAEVGIVIAKPYRAEGYGLAALLQMLRYAHSVLHLHQLYAVVATDNEACRKLFERAGFKADAELKDWIFDGDKYHDAVLLHFFVKR